MDLAKASESRTTTLYHISLLGRSACHRSADLGRQRAVELDKATAPRVTATALATILRIDLREDAREFLIASSFHTDRIKR